MAWRNIHWSLASGAGSPSISDEVRPRSLAQDRQAPRPSSPGISDSASSRARASSPRLVSCVAVAIMAFGQSRARARVQRVEMRPASSPNSPGSPPTSFSASSARVAVEQRVLQALGHHRAGELLEAAAEAQDDPRRRDGPDPSRLDPPEQARRRRSRGPTGRAARSSAWPCATVPSIRRDVLGLDALSSSRRQVGAVDRESAR